MVQKAALTTSTELILNNSIQSTDSGTSPEVLVTCDASPSNWGYICRNEFVSNQYIILLLSAWLLQIHKEIVYSRSWLAAFKPHGMVILAMEKASFQIQGSRTFSGGRGMIAMEALAVYSFTWSVWSFEWHMFRRWWDNQSTWHVGREGRRSWIKLSQLQD